MDDTYLDKMHKYENLCTAWMQKADAEYMEHDFQHTKQECYYLQQAVNMRAEMARISLGAEHDFQKRKEKELNERIAEIIRIIDPEYFKRKQRKMAEAKAAAGKKNPAGGTGAGKATAASSVDDDEVKNWFKDPPKHSFDDVTGMPELKRKLKNCINDAKRKTIREYLKLRDQKSYFFIGPPGCGKTYIVQAFAHELMDKDYKYLSLVGSDILSKYVGDAEKTITRLFEEAENNAPCIIFIDEIDGVCKNRSMPNLPEYAASITTAFLTGYNRINASHKPVIFIGATNYPAQVDNAMLDRVELITVPFPDKEGRVLKFRQELENIVKPTDGFSFEEMGDLTEAEDDGSPYNYRDIERLCEVIKERLETLTMEAYSSEDLAVRALKSGEFGVSRELFKEAQDRCLPTPKQSIISDLAKWREQFDRKEEK